MSLNIVNHYQYKHNTPVISKTLMPYFASHLIKKEKEKQFAIMTNNPIHIAHGKISPLLTLLQCV